MNQNKPVTPASIDEEHDAVLVALGARVRAIRTAKSLPRRVLSERSGVSPRYLAQLESGQGNISVRLLSRVARALGQPLDVLLGAPAGDAAHIANAYAEADAQTRQSVAELLNLSHLNDDRAQRVCLIGLRGAGKSTLGRALSQATRAPFLELTAEIERQGAMPVSEIIALYGFEGYRDNEGRVLNDIADQNDRVVLAVGGGIVSNEATFRILRQRFHTIWIKARPEEHMARVRAQGDLRPMEGNPRAMTQLRELLETREPVYAMADATLDTSDRQQAVSERELIELIRRRNFLG